MTTHISDIGKVLWHHPGRTISVVAAPIGVVLVTIGIIGTIGTIPGVGQPISIGILVVGGGIEIVALFFLKSWRSKGQKSLVTYETTPTRTENIKHITTATVQKCESYDKAPFCFYKIKNAANETVGYLLGTIHQLYNHSIEDLDPKIFEKQKKSKHFYPEISLNNSEALRIQNIIRKKNQISIDIILLINVQFNKGQKIISLDNQEYIDWVNTRKNSTLTVPVIKKKIQDEIASYEILVKMGDLPEYSKKIVECQIQILKSSFEQTFNGSRITKESVQEFKKMHEQASLSIMAEIWKSGIVAAIAMVSVPLCMSQEEIQLERAHTHKRNKMWMKDHLRERLKNSSKEEKFFVAVGYGHLVDIEKYNIVGLKTLIENEDFTLVPVIRDPQ